MMGGSLRSPFLRFEGFEGLNMEPPGILVYSHHVCFLDCTHHGLCKIWPDTIDHDESVRSRDDSHDVVVENMLVENANQGHDLFGKVGEVTHPVSIEVASLI